LRSEIYEGYLKQIKSILAYP